MTRSHDFGFVRVAKSKWKPVAGDVFEVELASGTPSTNLLGRVIDESADIGFGPSPLVYFFKPGISAEQIIEHTDPNALLVGPLIIQTLLFQRRCARLVRHSDIGKGRHFPEVFYDAVRKRFCFLDQSPATRPRYPAVAFGMFMYTALADLLALNKLHGNVISVD